MTVVFILLPLAVVLAIGFLGMFIWATKDGQFDDVRTPQLRVLFNDDPIANGESPRPGDAGAVVADVGVRQSDDGYLSGAHEAPDRQLASADKERL